MKHVYAMTGRELSLGVVTSVLESTSKNWCLYFRNFGTLSKTLDIEDLFQRIQPPALFPESHSAALMAPFGKNFLGKCRMFHFYNLVFHSKITVCSPKIVPPRIL